MNQNFTLIFKTIMKKLLALFCFTMLCIACSTEENLDTTDSTNFGTETVFEESVTLPDNYKGVFTTANGQHRGTLDVVIATDNRSATANLTLSTNEVVSITTTNITDLGNSKEIQFSSTELSFVMTTEAEGIAYAIEDVTFRGMDSGLLMAKNTERAPAAPFDGTYLCTTCASPVDNSQTQVFNFMFVTADGNSTIATQTTLNTTIYNGIGVQDNCVDNSNQRTCDITSGDGMTTVGYTAGGGDVTWSGTHRFNTEATGPNDCSEFSGTWQWTSPVVGTLDGTFTSDGTCPPASSPPLIFEDFEDAMVTYAINFPEEVSPNGEDFYTRTDGTNITSAYNVSNVQGDWWFAMMDTDGTLTNDNNNVTLTWAGIPVSGLTDIDVSILFAEDDSSDGNEDWDGGDTLRVEYSFTGGAPWTPIIAFANITGTTNGAPALDTDFNGLGDSTLLTPTLSEFTASFTNPGSSTLSVRIISNSLSQGDVDISFDNVTISGN